MARDDLAARMRATVQRKPPAEDRAGGAKRSRGSDDAMRRLVAANPVPEAGAEAFPHRVTLDLPTTAHRELRVAAASSGVPASSILRALLGLYLSDADVRSTADERARLEASTLRARKPPAS